MKDSACTITVARIVYFERTNHVKDHVRIERILSTLFRCYTWSDLYGLNQICDSPRLVIYNVIFLECSCTLAESASFWQLRLSLVIVIALASWPYSSSSLCGNPDYQRPPLS